MIPHFYLTVFIAFYFSPLQKFGVLKTLSGLRKQLSGYRKRSSGEQKQNHGISKTLFWGIKNKLSGYLKHALLLDSCFYVEIMSYPQA